MPSFDVHYPKIGGKIGLPDFDIQGPKNGVPSLEIKLIYHKLIFMGL